MLQREIRDTLFTLARAAIRSHLTEAPPPPLPGGPPVLAEVRGVFVTLRTRGALRGCVGHAVGRLPLAESVRSLAVAAAARDRRFEPVAPKELAELDVELTILSPLSPADPARIEAGVHGLYVARGPRSGLLLPQVATERGWDAPTFLAATCRKAGLPDDAWRDGETRVFWFTGECYRSPAGGGLATG